MSPEALEVLKQAGIPAAQAHAIEQAIAIETALARSGGAYRAAPADLHAKIQEVARDQARYVYGMFAIQTVILMIFMLAFADVLRSAPIP